MPDPTVIAIDWSGRKGADQIHYIRAAVVSPDGTIDIWCDLTRNDVIEELMDFPGDVVVGFDFSFGFPAWVSDCRGLDGPSLWDVVRSEGETWLRDAPEPFFGPKATRRRTDVELWRATEKVHRAKSTFQIAGAGAVGTGSIRGMPLLTQLAQSGYSIWPFDAAGARTVVEIYPKVLRPHARPSLPRRVARAVTNSDDTRDAVLSALVMHDERHQLTALVPALDARTRAEGQVWTPNFAR